MKLKTLHFEDITIAERFRKSYTQIEDLKESIKLHGLIQPIAVRESDDGKYLLLAGGRRMKAIQMLHDIDGIDIDIPARVYESTTEYRGDLDDRIIELEENIQREDLTWQEEDELRKRIYDLQVERFGRKVSKGNEYSNKEFPGVTQEEVANKLGIGRTTLRKSILLAGAMEKIPAIKKCKTRDEAMKILTKMGEDYRREELVKELKTKRSNTPTERTRKNLVNSYIIKDFFEGIRGVKDNTIDIVEIDPPYAIDLKRKKKESGGKTVTRNYNEVDTKEYRVFMQRVVNECYRVMRKNSWMIVWFGPEPWFETMYNIIAAAGKPEKMHIDDWRKSGECLTVRRIPGIWTKGAEGSEGTGQTMQPDYYMANSYEMFFYACKGKPSFNRKGRSNHFAFKPVPPMKKSHPTERPIELMQEILSTFVQPGSRILVPFLGSGNTLLAANNLMMEGFGYDLSKEYKNSFTLKVYDSLPQTYKSY